GGAVDEELRVLHAVGVGHEGLGFLDGPYRIMQRIDLRKNGDIELVDIAAGVTAQAFIDPLTIFVAGRMKGGDPAARTRKKDIQERGALLVSHLRTAFGYHA